MKVFITGATGYIGGSLAAKLISLGHAVSGLVRTKDKAAQLEARRITPVLGTLADVLTVSAAAKAADAVINTANSDDFFVASALVDALADSGKPLLHTSGSSVVADRAAGEFSRAIYNEDSPVEPLPERMLRVAVDKAVLAAAQRDVRTVVIRPTLIYGRGHGLNPHSMQVPHLIELAKKYGIGRHVGRGLNVWSHVYIDDVVSLYIAALEKAPAGTLYYAENGEVSWKVLASAIGQMLGFGADTKDWPITEAMREWGAGAITSYGSNSRVRAHKARKMLDWTPSGPPLLQEIATTYREDFDAGR